MATLQVVPGTLIAKRYTVLAGLHQGAAASVYKAADLSNGGAPVALKVVCGDQSNDVLEEFFSREVESLRRLRHEHVVRLLDAGVDDTVGRWLTLEWLDRGNLQDPSWQAVHRDGARLLELLRDMLDALAVAHRLGVIHRDIKPSNILFDSQGVPKLADFNVSKLLGRTRSTKTVRAYMTPRWAAPEQREGRPADERSDVFALGRIAAELLTGFDGDEVTTLVQQLERPGGPGALRHLLKRMLSHEIAGRPTAHEALKEIEAILEQSGPEWKLPVRLTRKVLDDLTNLQGGNLTPKEVLDLVRVDLGGRIAVEPTTRDASRGGTTYTLIGKRYSYRAVSPADLGATTDELALVSVIRLATHQREAMRSACVALPFVADILGPNTPPGRGTAVRDFISAFGEARTSREADRQGQYVTSAQLDAWQSYLDLSRALKSERSRLGMLRKTIEREGEGLLECRIEPLLVSPDELTDSWVSYLAPGGQLIALGLVVEASEGRVVVRPHDELGEDAELPTGGQLVRDARREEASLQRQATALRMLRQRADAEGDLLELLARPEKVGPARRVHIEPYTRDLDESNRQVVESALGVDRLYLVQGPPGTGKTTVIAELIAQILSRESESRILLVSQSNVAIDNVLERLERLLPEVPAVRLGRADKVGSQAKHLMLHDRLAEEAQRLRQRAALAHDRMQRLAARDVEEIDWLHAELTAAEASTADRTTARQFAEEMVGPVGTGGESALERRLQAASALRAGGDAVVADILQLQEGWLSRIQAGEDLEEQMLQSIRVIAGTCVGVVATRAIGDARFDWVIVDEAGRASPPELLVPLVRGRRLVLLGDHRQLPPVLDEEITDQVVERLAIPKEKLLRSLFEDLFETVPESSRNRLVRQYRMHPDIGGLVEHVFYPEGLDHAVTAAQRPWGVAAWGAALRWVDTGDTPLAVERRVGSSYRNAAEVRVVVEELDAMDQRLANVEGRVSVGVLTAYLAQQEALQDAIVQRRRAWKVIDVSVLTVDAAQGKEFDLVFYSAVRANPSGRIGFLRDERRLNVALSRARHGLTIVGDLSSLVMAGTRFGSNPFVGVQAWFAKDAAKRPIVRRTT